MGYIGAAVGLSWLLFVNCFTAFLLIKTKNKFKKSEILSIGDLAFKVFGENAKTFTDILIMLSYASYLICFNSYFGIQFE